MLPRSQSIFHLGEEGAAAAQYHRGSIVWPATMVGGDRRRLRERLVVGLQILVHHQHGGGGHYHHHGRHAHAHAASIVLKQMVRPPHRAAAASCSFLEACSMCRRELSPNKDVYMYRGDQGFCSEECRWQQIVVDEAREREAISKERRGLPAAAHRRSPHHTPIRGRPARPRKTLAVA